MRWAWLRSKKLKQAIEVVRPGIQTTVQDLGRFGYQRYGVSVSGAMDKFSLRVGNLLVGNAEGEAVLEMTALGPKLKLYADLTVAFTGGDFGPKVNGKPLPMWRSVTLQRHDVISFAEGSPSSGFRSYMSVSGGIDVPLVMGSRSTHLLSGLGGLGRQLAKGDFLSVGDSGNRPAIRGLREDQIPVYSKELLVRVVPGPQEDYFTPAGITTFYNESYQITSKSNRVGYRLKGPVIEHQRGADILSDATPSGSVQVPGDGMPIILLADGQTTGGYAKIGVVVSPDQDILAQAPFGFKLKFQRVGLSEAYRIIDQAEEKINNIKSFLDSTGF